MGLSREFTSTAMYWVDQLTPPILRDCRLLSAILFRPMLGRKETIFNEFFTKMYELTEDEYATYYERAGDPIQRQTDLTTRSAESLVSSIRNQTVLDAGCGKGFLSQQLAKANTVTAIDIAPPYHLKNSNLTVRAGSVEALPFENNSFDATVCTHTLEHVIDFQKALSELRRVTKSTLYVVVPLQRPYRYTPDLHVRFFAYPELFLMEARPPSGRYEYRVIDRDLLYVEQRS